MKFECDAVVFQKTLGMASKSCANGASSGSGSGATLTTSTDVGSATDDTSSGIGKMLCDPAVLAVILAHTSTSTVNICFAQWAPTVLMESHGLTPALAGACLATANAVDIAGNFLSAGFEFIRNIGSD